MDTLSPESSGCSPLPPEGETHTDLWLEGFNHIIFCFQLYDESKAAPYLHGAVLEEFLDVFSHTGSSHTFRVRAADVAASMSEERKRRKVVSGRHSVRKREIRGGASDSPPTLQSVSQLHQSLSLILLSCPQPQNTHLVVRGLQVGLSHFEWLFWAKRKIY